MPAEWEPHDGTWLIWPCRKEIWRGRIEEVKRVFAQVISEVTCFEPVHLCVADFAMEAEARRWLNYYGCEGVFYHRIRTDDSWCRDSGAILTRSSYGLVALNWEFNSWGKRYLPYDQDEKTAKRMAACMELPFVDIPLVLEGGSIDVNGCGDLLTTKSCLLNENRNPSKSSLEIEGFLGQYLGVDRVIWLEGGLLDDDTDGHVDNVARFVSKGVVMASVSSDASNPNYLTLQRNKEILSGFFEVIPLPLPEPVKYGNEVFVASYANFYVLNSLVLVPVFGRDEDRSVLGLIGDVFPDRKVVGVDSTTLVLGGGSFHCITQQVPKI